MSQVTGKTYLRVLPYRLIAELSRQLDKPSVSNLNWKGVASLVKKKNGQDKYDLGRIGMFELELHRGKSPTEQLISDWGTSNATVQDLVKILEELDILSCIDILLPEYNAEKEEQQEAEKVQHETKGTFSSFSPHKVKEETVSSTENQAAPDTGSWNTLSENKVSSSSDTATNQPCETSFNLPEEQSSLPPGPQQHDKAIQYRYQDLYDMTDQFNDAPLSEGGCRIGEGGFGTVYRGIFAGNKLCAIKKLKKEILSDEKIAKQFTMEHTTLSKLKHPNLVGLYGYSYDGSSLCLVFEYLPNGSLNECLSCKDGQQKPLQWPTRIRIAQGAAQGICFLHRNGHIHRDIKSANILLDEQYNAKMGDFGLVKALPQQHTGGATAHASMATTTTVIGTQVYMAPEAMYGKFSTLSDSFSFGVVLLELMTGLAVISDTREYPDIITHVDYKMQKENTDFIKLMDKKMDHHFDEESVQKMHSVAAGLLEEKIFNRMELSKVLDDLTSL